MSALQDVVFFALIITASGYIFRDAVDLCNEHKCNLQQAICATEFMSVGRDPTCLSAQEIDDVTTGIIYKYIVRPKYLRIPFAKTFQYFPLIKMWKEVSNVWSRRGRAMKIAPSLKSAGHLYMITSIAITQRYLFKFRGVDGVDFITTTTVTTTLRTTSVVSTQGLTSSKHSIMTTRSLSTMNLLTSTLSSTAQRPSSSKPLTSTRSSSSTMDRSTSRTRSTTDRSTYTLTSFQKQTSSKKPTEASSSTRTRSTMDRSITTATSRTRSTMDRSTSTLTSFQKQTSSKKPTEVSSSTRTRSTMDRSITTSTSRTRSTMDCSTSTSTSFQKQTSSKKPTMGTRSRSTFTTITTKTNTNTFSKSCLITIIMGCTTAIIFGFFWGYFCFIFRHRFPCLRFFDRWVPGCFYNAYSCFCPREDRRVDPIDFEMELM